MSLAFKNFSLYPASHSICLQSIRTFDARLREYLKIHGDLRLLVWERTLSLNDNEVYQDNDEKDQLAALFYRDGIKWFELQRGISLREISKLLVILKINRVQPEEYTGDIATALWEADLPHLDYEAVDFMSDTGEITDPLVLKSVPDGAALHLDGAGPGGAAVGVAPGDMVDYEKISVRLRQGYDLELNAAEEESLKLMVQAEEAKNIGQEALEILLIILEEQEEKGDFKSILSFIKEEFLFDLGAGEFKDMCNLLTRLRQDQIKYRQEKPWAAMLLNEFFQEISTPGTVEILAEVLVGYDDPNLKESLAKMARIFQLMSPAVFPSLAALLTKGYSELVELSLLVALKSLAGRDISLLAKLLPKGEALLVLKLLPMVAALKEEGGADLLENLVEHHDERVRIRVLEIIISLGTKIDSRHYHLVDDHNPIVRQLALKLLGSERSELVESFLLNYLDNEQYTISDDNHLLACYRALGGCGSGRSIPYLHKTLTEGTWKGFVGMDKTVLRHAAAWALSLLDNPTAKKVLREGAASKYSAVQKACDIVLGKNQ